MTQKQKIRRRTFIQGSAAVAGGFWVAAGTQTAKAQSPNEKINIGIIGVNGRGRANTGGVAGENIVALCDIDERYLAGVGPRFPKAKTYIDWREMVDQKDLDAVVISTADQVHALASCWAMRRGLAVYCEKPLSHSVHEARVVQETYLKEKVPTQMGTQIHATENYRRVVELVQGGAIGPVREAHVWCGRRGPGGGLPEGENPCPAELKWDLWLGPAPYRPYNKSYMPGNLTWNRWWDFGNGTLGDMGSHLIDLPFWALKLRDPITCETEGFPAEPSPYTNPQWLEATWEHPARGDMPACTVKWYDNVRRPESPEGVDLTKWHIGVMFVGDKGKLVADYGKHILLPADQYANYERPERSIAPSLGHHKEWLAAIRADDHTATLCNFDYSGKLIEHNLLSNVAYRVGKKLQWDAANLRATNAPEADQYIRREYREGWSLDG